MSILMKNLKRCPYYKQKTFDFNNSNKTNTSNDAEIEEEENTNTYFKPVNNSKGSNKEKEDTNTYKEEGKQQRICTNTVRKSIYIG